MASWRGKAGTAFALRGADEDNEPMRRHGSGLGSAGGQISRGFSPLRGTLTRAAPKFEHLTRPNTLRSRRRPCNFNQTVVEEEM